MARTVTEIQARKALSKLPGNYREIFFERSSGFSLRMLNGRVEAPNSRSHEGFSLLSRSGKDVRFGAFPRLDRIEEDVAEFCRSNGFAEESEPAAASAKIAVLEPGDPLSDAEPIFSVLSRVPEIAGKHPFVTSYEVVANFSYRAYAVATSKGAFGKDLQKYHSFYVILSGKRDGAHEEVMGKITGTDILHRFDAESLLGLFEQTARDLDRALSGESAPSGEMDVVIGNESGGTIIHEAVGHGLEADLQSSSVYRGKLGQKVASDEVTVVDDPTIPGLRGFYALDHEGNPAKKTVLIEKGVLVSYMHQNRTAELFGTESTGHARRESYACETLVRMGSTYLAPGKHSKEEIVASVKDGLYVSKMGGGQVNTVTGDFVFKVASGFRIRNGKKAESVRGANISGNGPRMLSEIRMVGNDLEHFDGGTCGKGQQMPVSDATPTVLVRLKVTG
ncbi:MAG: PmbA TldD protein [Patescibacteria group bacterium]|nr:PmbA TldD protein [Patescibacteria group bacterium]